METHFFAMLPSIGMKKWITSNYHYMVPEYDETTKIQHNFTSYLEDLSRAKQVLGENCATPVIMGPVSLSRWTRISAPGTSIADLVRSLVPIYSQLFQQVAALGFTKVQVHEPVLVFAEPELSPLFALAYPATIRSVSNRLAINIVSFMDDVGTDNYQWLIAQPEISIISMESHWIF
jgi:5-methyltetrahydropteroyltriglutamate--homocysteine methyltransferase